MATRFYHNISKRKFNLIDMEELAESYTIGNKIMFTESGDAIVKEPDERMEEEFKKEMLNSFSVIIKHL
jgi:hypothetical protein